MIRTYTNASDAADAAHASALQAMVDERFAAQDAARMEYLNARVKMEIEVCRYCGKPLHHVERPRRYGFVCSDYRCRNRAKKEIA